MRLPLRLCLFIAFALLSGCGDRRGDRATSASEFPEKPIRVVVPFSPGGGSDIFARAVQQAVAENHLLPHGLVIENQPGAGGTIGSRTVMNETPDGYRILFLHDAIITARYAGQAEFGPEAFAPTAATGELGAVIVVGPESRFQSLGELMNAASAAPETISFAANMGAPSHFWALLLENASPQGTARFRFVQSGGGALRFGDLKGGHIEASAFSVAEHLQFQSEGLRALAYLGEQRHPALADVPTALEQGFDVVAGNLQSWWAPLGTPTERIAVIADALEKAMQSDSLIQRMDEWKIEPVFLDAEQLREEIAERERAVRNVAARGLPSQPNLPKWSAMVTALVALWTAWGCWKNRERPVGAPTAEKSGIPWPSLTLFGSVTVLIALWQLNSLSFAWMAGLLVVVSGFQLRQRISGLDLLILIAIAAGLALGSQWLFTNILSVTL